MSVIDLLLDLFRDEDQRTEFETDPTAYLTEHGLEGLTADDVLAALPGLCGSLPPEQADAVRAAYGLPAPAGAGAASALAASPIAAHVATLPPPPPPDPAADPLEAAVQQLNYFTTVTNVTQQTYEDNDTTIVDDRDTTVDQSVNQDMTVFGDVTQDFDNDVVSGDGAVAAGDGSQVSTGDGAVQAGGDITDSTVATGDVEGSVTGDVDGGVVGDGNVVISDSDVGAAAFGDGDATNVEADNAVLGDGTLVDGGDGDISLNQGDGDLTQIDHSDIDESAIGDGGTVTSDDVDIDAVDGSSVAFGEGSTSSAEDQYVDVDDNAGTVQVGGDGDQAGLTDNSVTGSFDTEGSFNTDVDLTDNSIDTTYDVDGSFNDDHSATDTAIDVTTDTTIEDNDVLDV